MPDPVGVEEWQRRYDEFMVMQYDLTMRRLIHTIRHVSPLSDEIIDELRQGEARLAGPSFSS